MKVLYTRVSTDGQSLDRQLIDGGEYNHIIKEKGVSGTIPFWSRPQSSHLKEMLVRGDITELHIHSLDRLGRNLKDILQTIDDFHSYGVPIHITSQGLVTLDKNTGKMNPTTSLILSVMGSVAQMERELTSERIKHSLEGKKRRGELLGRKVGSSESLQVFLSKPKTKKVVKLLDKHYSVREICSILNVSTQLVMKVRKVR
jgi:DNA invertase Pin-like site-specific DNA recombinase